MRKLYDKVIILSILLSSIFISCANQVIPYIKISDISYEESYIKVSLSNEPNENKCIEAFSFYKDDIEIKGSFNFSEKDFYFYPVEKIDAKHDYIVEITTELEDTNGHSLQYLYIYEFSTKEENIPPYILSVTPKNESEVTSSDITPKIIFSEAINKKSFSEAFSITPSIPYFCVWAGDFTSVEIVFEKELSKNTTYTMTINTSLTDLSNNRMRAEYKSNFIYCPKTEHPFSYNVFLIDENEYKLNNSTTTEASNKASFRIDFSNEVSIDTISSYISFYPELRVSYVSNWETSKSLAISLSEVPEWNKTYTLTINSGLSDVYSQKVTDKQSFNIIFSKEKNRPVDFIKGYFLTEEGATAENKFFPIDYSNVYNFLNIPVEYTGNQPIGQSEYVTKNLNLYCIFRISDEAQGLDIPSVLSGIKINPTNSCLSIIIEKCHFYTDAEYEASPIGSFQFTQEDTSEWNLAVICLDLTVQVYRAEGLIRFTFNDSIMDNLGNKMKEELLFSYNKS